MDGALGEQLESLRAQLVGVRLPLAARDADQASAVATRAAGQIRDYILPRLRSLDAPLLTVVGGSTGSGKSTVVNSLVGRTVSTPGVLRPTTRHPVLVHNPADERWFIDDRVLPRLPRLTGWDPAAGPPGVRPVLGLQLVADEHVPEGLALLDAPDLDSVSGANRDLAAMLMAAADLWLFLTTAARYADAVPWAALRGAVARDAAIAVILNRVPPEAIAQVREHLGVMLAEEGLGSAPLFVLPEQSLRTERIRADLVAPISAWLAGLAGDAAARAAVARRTLDGAVANLAIELLPVADAADRQVLAAARLRGLATAAFGAATSRVLEVASDGSLLRGEVLARWQDFVGASELFRSLETGLARARDRVGRALRSQPNPPEVVTEALETGLARVLLDELAAAFERADHAWREDPIGRALLEATDLAEPPSTARGQVQALVRAWQADVVTMVRSEGADRRSSARALAYGVNGAGLALMVLVFGATGGLTGAEVGIAGGTAVLAQKLLEAVFSEDAVRRMSHAARDRLAERVGEFYALHARTFTDRLDGLGLDPEAGPRIRQTVAAVLDARRSESHRELPPAPPPEVAGRRSTQPETRSGMARRMRAWFRGEA